MSWVSPAGLRPLANRSVSTAVSSRERHEALLDGVRALALIPPTVTPTSAAGKRRQEVCSPFVAAAVCEALCSAGDHGIDARAGLGEITRYLRDTQEGDGSWCFDPHELRWPPDADSTSCAVAALARAGEMVAEPILDRILHLQPSVDGLIRTWLVWYSEAEERLDCNAADAIVTANVLVAATRVGHDVSGLLGALEDHVRSRGLGGVATTYYDSLPMRSYYLARAVAPISGDGPTARAVRQFLADVDTESLNAVDIAAALAAAALLGVDPVAERLLPRLLAGAGTRGARPEGRWFTDPAGNAWRSAAFSTALAVEALVLTSIKLAADD